LGLCIGLGFYVGGSAVVLIRTIRKSPAQSYSQLGWGNPLSALPASWQRWLLDDPDPNRRGRFT